jgi:hypothetical protein
MTDKIQEIFEQSCEMDREKRASFIRDACGNDAELRAEVESLLTAHDSAGEFLSSPTGGFVEPAPVAPSLPEEPGKVIGRYKLLESIGEGGFGVVYMGNNPSQFAVVSRSRSSSWEWTRSKLSLVSKRSGRRWR